MRLTCIPVAWTVFSEPASAWIRSRSVISAYCIRIIVSKTRVCVPMLCPARSVDSITEDRTYAGDIGRALADGLARWPPDHMFPLAQRKFKNKARVPAARGGASATAAGASTTASDDEDRAPSRDVGASVDVQDIVDSMPRVQDLKADVLAKFSTARCVKQLAEVPWSSSSLRKPFCVALCQQVHRVTEPWPVGVARLRT